MIAVNHALTRMIAQRYATGVNNANKEVNFLSSPVVSSPLDTLAQLRKPLQNQPSQQAKKTLYKRAKAKYISNNLALKLKDLRSDLERSYFRTFGCASTLEQKGEKITGMYCNNRWCLVCNRIRTAKLIKGYMQPLSELNDPYFVTLTTPNVSDKELRTHIKYMTRTFTKIKDMHRKAKDPIKGLRKTECTFNPRRNDYNPHFHLIVEGKATAQAIIKQWVNRIEGAHLEAQDMRPADDNSIYELFKYFTKLSYKGGTNLKALDNIFQAMQGMRTFQPFGIKKVSEDIEELQSEIYKEIEQREATWLWCEDDWIDISTGETLTGHTPSEALKDIAGGFTSLKTEPPPKPPEIAPNNDFWNVKTLQVMPTALN